MGSPIGTLYMTIEDQKITEVVIANDSSKQDDPLDPQIHDYFGGKTKSFNFQLNPKGTPFQLRVWEAISRIPYGKTWTYTELAKVVGSGPRAVANACGRNPLPLLIPCHRVIRQDGSLGGYSGGDGLATKKYLLRLEGAL